ncbi:MAG: T9SS type A sorting domain-containing protein [Saprospiraceae bacterium]
MKKSFLLLLFSCAVASMRAQDTVNIHFCTSFWYDGSPVEGSTLGLNIVSPGLPPVSILSQDTSCIDYMGIVPDDLPPGSSLTFYAENETDPLNGVNVLDLVAMSDHILGLIPLQFPYALFAADANKSNSVTAFDIVETRKLILGIYDEFPNNSSWRFFPENCDFPNPANPFSGGNCPGLTFDDLMQLDNDTFLIYGVKIGDVTGDANPNGNYSGPDFVDSTFLDIPDVQLLAGVPTTIDIKLGGTFNLDGLQCQFLYNADKVSLDAVVQTPYFTNNNFALFLGKINAAGFSTSGMPQGETLISFIFTANETVQLSDVFSLNPSVFVSMGAIHNNGLKAVKLGPSPGASSVVANPAAVQLVSPASPNPFEHQTSILLRLENPETVLLEVYDLNGQRRYTIENQFAAGDQRLDIPAEALSKNSIGYYRLRAGNTSATGKLIRL